MVTQQPSPQEGLLFSSDGGVSWKKGITPEQKTDVNIKAETIETERMNLVNQSNKIGSALSSNEIEFYGETSSDLTKVNNKGFIYNSDGTKKLVAGISEDNNSYGFNLLQNGNSIFNILAMLNSDSSEMNVNTDSNLNGRSVFNNTSYQTILGGKANEQGDRYLEKDSVTYYLRIFSIAYESTNILTVFANGNAYLGGTISSYDEDNIDYVRIVDGGQIQTSQST